MTVTLGDRKAEPGVGKRVLETDIGQGYAESSRINIDCDDTLHLHLRCCWLGSPVFYRPLKVSWVSPDRW